VQGCSFDEFFSEPLLKLSRLSKTTNPNARSDLIIWMWPRPIASGASSASTLSKEAAREVLRTQVIQQLEPLMGAMIDGAMGIKHRCGCRPEGWSRRD